VSRGSKSGSTREAEAGRELTQGRCNTTSGRYDADEGLAAECCSASEGLGSKLPDGGAKFEYLKRAVWPVVLPAHDEVASIWIMAVVAKASAGVLELDANPFPPVAPDAAFGVAVGLAGLNAFNDVAEFVSDHPEQEHDTLFVNWRML
jgi:hypothetical protein